MTSEHTPHPSPPDPSPPAAGAGGIGRLVSTIVIGNLHNGSLAAGRLTLPLILLDMGGSKMLVGILGSLFTAIPMLMTVRFGRWIDRAGTLTPIVLCIALLVAPGLLMLVRPGPWSLLVAASLVGAGAMFSHIVTTRAVAGVSGDLTRARNLGYLAAGYSLFQFICPLLAGFSYDHLGTAMAVAVITMFPLLSLLMLVTGFHLYAKAPPGPAAARRTGGTLRLFADVELRRWATAYSIFAASQSIFPFIVSVYAVEIGLNASQAGALLGALALGALVARVSSPWLVTLFRSKVLLCLALLMSAAAYCMLPFLHEWRLLTGLCLLLGLSLGSGQPVSMLLLYGAAPEGRINETVGAVIALTNFLQLTTPLALGVIASAYGIAPMAWLLALMLGFAAFLSARAPSAGQ